MHARTHTRTQASTLARTHTRARTHTQARARARTHTHTHTHTHTRVNHIFQRVTHVTSEGHKSVVMSNAPWFHSTLYMTFMHAYDELSKWHGDILPTVLMYESSVLQRIQFLRHPLTIATHCEWCNK